MKIENLLNEVFGKYKVSNDFYDFVLVCTEAGKELLSRLQSKNVKNILDYGFENEYISFYINKYISNNPIFEEYNIGINTIDDYLEYGKKREKYPIIRTEVTFPIKLLFERKSYTLKRTID